MNETSLIEALQATLDDIRLSRGERRAVRSMVKRQIHSKQQRDALRAHAFRLAQGELQDPHSKAVLEWVEEVVKAIQPDDNTEPTPRQYAYFAPHDDCPHRLITLLNGCRKSADICVFTITDDRVAEAIQQAHHRGANVRIISDNHKAIDPGSDIRRLSKRGLEVRVDPTPRHMHHKFAVIDAKTLVTGSYNWTRSASTGNFENLVMLSEDPIVAQFTQEFERLWNLFDGPLSEV